MLAPLAEPRVIHYCGHMPPGPTCPGGGFPASADVEDPLRHEPNFYGAEVTRTARIEPRTPEGDIYVTDPFAALLMLEADRQFSCEYVGHIPAAKDYGVLPMYVLRRRS